MTILFRFGHDLGEWDGWVDGYILVEMVMVVIGWCRPHRRVEYRNADIRVVDGCDSHSKVKHTYMDSWIGCSTPAAVLCYFSDGGVNEWMDRPTSRSRIAENSLSHHREREKERIKGNRKQHQRS